MFKLFEEAYFLFEPNQEGQIIWNKTNKKQIRVRQWVFAYIGNLLPKKNSWRKAQWNGASKEERAFGPGGGGR